MATPGTDDVDGCEASEISELRRTAKWREPIEAIQSVVGRFNFFAMDRLELLCPVKELVGKMVSPRSGDLVAFKRVVCYTIKYPRMAIRYPWTELDSNLEVFGDANFAGCNCSTRKSTVGGVALCSGQFVKAWIKARRILTLSSGSVCQGSNRT